MFEHLEAIEARLVRERQRLSQETKQAAIEWREHNIHMIEKEIADERAFLEKKYGINVDRERAQEIENLLKELFE